MLRGVGYSAFLFLSSLHLCTDLRSRGDISARRNKCSQLSQEAGNGGENRISLACDQDQPSVEITKDLVLKQSVRWQLAAWGWQPSVPPWRYAAPSWTGCLHICAHIILGPSSPPPWGMPLTPLLASSFSGWHVYAFLRLVLQEFLRKTT